jgi:hypothetical protein
VREKGAPAPGVEGCDADVDIGCVITLRLVAGVVLVFVSVFVLELLFVIVTDPSPDV